MLTSDFITPPPGHPLAGWLTGARDVVRLFVEGFGELFARCEGGIEGQVHETATVSGEVVIGAGSRIHAHVHIEGPAVIGRNVSIRPHAIIRPQTYLGDGCVVGHAADIKHAICMDGCKLQDGVFVGDSLLGFGARVGSGVITANRRFDQKKVMLSGPDGAVPTGLDFFSAVIGDYARIGANAVLCPGTAVGPYTWVGPGVVLRGHYGPDLLILAEQALDIRPKPRTELRSGAGGYEVV
ncbi:MAG TPA: hypothetical protein VE891_03415 [Allosphingosinicella sp.]|nr:hypothetical protein [Allosphingosinicella sp.]